MNMLMTNNRLSEIEQITSNYFLISVLKSIMRVKKFQSQSFEFFQEASQPMKMPKASVSARFLSSGRQCSG